MANYLPRDLQNITLPKDTSLLYGTDKRPPNEVEDNLRECYKNAKSPQDRILVLEDWERYLRNDIAGMNVLEREIYEAQARAFIDIALSEIEVEVRRLQMAPATPVSETPSIRWEGTLVDLVIVMDCLKKAGLTADAPDSLIVKHFQHESNAKNRGGSYRQTRTRIAQGGAYPSDKVERLLEELQKALRAV